MSLAIVSLFIVFTSSFLAGLSWQWYYITSVPKNRKTKWNIPKIKYKHFGTQ